VSDGHKLYSYVPQDKQVIVSTVPAGDQASTPALFLTGQGDLTRDFTAGFETVQGAPTGAIALKLTPRKREAEYDSLTLVVEPGTLRLLMLLTTDPQGGKSSFTFTNLKENVGLADSHFVFQMPRNVDVVSAGAR
jgi:outer membrane lipoprotein-sorting protein